MKCNWYNNEDANGTDYFMKNEITSQQLHSNIPLYEKCKLWQQLNTEKLITNNKLNITQKKGTGNCEEREVIYTWQCSKPKVLHNGHTGEQLLE